MSTRGINHVNKLFFLSDFFNLSLLLGHSFTLSFLTTFVSEVFLLSLYTY